MNSTLTSMGMDYADMYNWTMDIPADSRKDFIDTLLELPKKSKILEIGTYTGTSIVEMLNILPEASATVVDVWGQYQEYDNNIPQLNIRSIFDTNTDTNTNTNTNTIRVLDGKISDSLLLLLMENKLFNLIYINGLSLNKYIDIYINAMFSWKLLEIGGVIIFDDYLFNKRDSINSTYEIINTFLKTISGDYIVLINNYRLFLRKIN